jgi:ribosomal protein S27AE
MKGGNMKNSEQCPKCGHDSFFVARGWTGVFGTGQYVKSHGFMATPVKLDRHICLGCGYVEEWISSDKDLQQLREKSDVS